MTEPARWWVDAAGTVGIATVVAVLALWLQHSGLQAAMAGGATVTSEAYAQSLQAALDAAHLN